MIDPRPGDAILFVGAGDPALAGECGAVAGLNGRTVVADANASMAGRVEAAAVNAGALVEFAPAHASYSPVRCGHVRTGRGAGPGGLAGTRATAAVREDLQGCSARRAHRDARDPQARLPWSGATAQVPARDQVLHLFTRAGAVAARELANTDGVAYYEGRKPR